MTSTSTGASTASRPSEDVDSDAEILDSASEQCGNDLVGRIALDDLPDHDALYALAGLDDREWSIVGVSLAGDRVGGFSAASVYAVSRSRVDTFDDLVTFARAHGDRISVVEIELDIEQGALRLLEHIFKRWTIHATLGELADHGVGLTIMAHRTLDGEAVNRMSTGGETGRNPTTSEQDATADEGTTQATRSP